MAFDITQRCLSVLYDLVDYNAITLMNAITINDLLTGEHTDLCKGMSPSTAYNCLERLQYHDLVAVGVKQGTANTYFITKKGIAYYENYLA